MGYEIGGVEETALLGGGVINESAHPVRRCLAKDLPPYPEGVTASFSQVYVKDYRDKNSIEEEVTFSNLYRMDIGKGAARNRFLLRGGQRIGVVSYALPKFTDYRKLFTRKNTPLREEVFECDQFGRAKKLRCVRGLADILMSAWLYGEDDLHRGNIGIAHDKKGQPYWARLDFGMSFSSITQAHRLLRDDIAHYNAITPEGLEAFPDLGAYAPFYWPTSITIQNNLFNIRGKQKGNAYSASDKAFFNGLREAHEGEAAKQFQTEKYRFLYKLFLSDINDKKKLIKANIKDKHHANRLASQIENRILTMQWTALCDPGFQAFVETIDGDLKGALVDEVCTNLRDVLDTSLEKEACQEKQRHLHRQVQALKAEHETNSDYETTLSEIDDLDLEIDKLLSEEHLEVAQLEEKQEILRQAQSKLLNQYLKSGEGTKGLEAFNVTLYRRNALFPITHIVSMLKDHDYLVYYFGLLREQRIIPAVKSLNGLGSDAIYQHKLPECLRQMEQLIASLLEGNIDDELRAYLPEIAFREVNNNIDIAIQEVKSITQVLLHFKCRQSISPLLLRIDEMDSKTTTPPVLKTANTIIKDISCNWFKPYLGHCLAMNIDLADIEKSPLLLSLNQLDSLFNDILSDELLQRSKGEAYFERDMERIERIRQKYHLDDLLSAEKNKINCEHVTKALAEIELVLTRLALDLQREVINNSPLTLATPLQKELLSASFKLSKALSQPEYHDTLEMQAVSRAGYLGAKALKDPSLDNARACIDHARYLENSHQTRKATKVATALAILSAVIVIAAVSALSWPAGIAVAASIAAWCALGFGSSTFLAMGAYATKRFFRDKDKVKRKLSDVGERLDEMLTQPTLVSV